MLSNNVDYDYWDLSFQFFDGFRKCFANHERACERQCLPSCLKHRYIATVQEKQWPASQRIKFSRNSAALQELQNCCAIISIRYLNSEITFLTFRPKYEVNYIYCPLQLHYPVKLFIAS